MCTPLYADELRAFQNLFCLRKLSRIYHKAIVPFDLFILKQDAQLMVGTVSMTHVRTGSMDHLLITLFSLLSKRQNIIVPREA